MFIVLPYRPDASWRHPPRGTVGIMLSLLLIHIVWGRGGPDALEPYLLNFQALAPLQWLTSAFLHADWFHLCGNLVFLFVFGAIVEDHLGRWMIPAYLLLAVSSGALEQCISLLEHRQGFALGASSAIYGLVAMATLWAPRTHVSTFIWAIPLRPRTVRIRVLWLAGCYMVLQVLSVWIQGGEPSSEFLHACGIVAGLGLGFLCLREKWVQTDGEDLLAPEQPRRGADPVVAPGVPWEEQAARLDAATASGECRVALAAYEVLRRDHPTRLPGMPALERLVALCEENLDFHRAVAITERALAAGPISDALRLRFARICGLHLGNAETGLAHLSQIRSADLPDRDQMAFVQLRSRLERRIHQEPSMHAPLLPLALLTALAGLGLTAQAATDQRPPALEPIELQTATGRISLPGGAAITLPEDVLYVTWPELQRFFILPPPSSMSFTPLGTVITEENLALLSDKRNRALSRGEWEQVSIDALVRYDLIQVFWDDGWIDTAEPLPAPGQLLADLQLQSQVINNRQLAGPGVQIGFDFWEREPAFDSKRGVLTWSIHMGWSVKGLGAPGGAGVSVRSIHACHLGARGVLHLLCEDANPAVPTFALHKSTLDRMKEISDQVTWDKQCGFVSTQPLDVGERVGGFRRLVQPRIIFTNSNDELVFRRGLGYAWILIILPIAAAILIFLRWCKGIAQSTRRPSSTIPGAADRCPKCGTSIPPAAARCLACGTSLARQQG